MARNESFYFLKPQIVLKQNLLLNMRLVLLLSLFLLLASLSLSAAAPPPQVTNKKTPASTPAPAAANSASYSLYTADRLVERRGPVSYEYFVNVLTKFNSSYTFPSVMIGSNERVALWLLTQQTTQSFQNNNTVPNTLAIYDPRSLPRSTDLTTKYACLPSEQDCRQLSIDNFNLDNLGVYTFRFDTTDYLVNKIFQFNVSAYANPQQMSCSSDSSSSSCNYNTSTQTLSVLADQVVSINCSIVIQQNDLYPISAQLNFFTERYGEECIGNSTLSLQSPLFSKGLSDRVNRGVDNLNALSFQLSKSCQRTFSRQETGKLFSCQLNPTPLAGLESPQYQRNSTYETVNVKMDVQYGPDPTMPLNPPPLNSQSYFNKTIMFGNAKTTFNCPFVGNPTPNYYWRVVSVSSSNSTSSSSSSPSSSSSSSSSKRRILTPSNDFSLSSQDYTIPSNLEIGSYVFECKSQVLGLVNNYSQSVQFNLIVTSPPAPPTKRPTKANPESRFIQIEGSGTNVGAIVGGVIGGVVFLILIIVAILLFLRFKRNKKEPKDEIEKAKELDIDITDDGSNPHLNPRKNLSANGGGLTQQLNAQQQQQQQQQSQSKQASNGIGHKVIAGLMVPSSTAQSYAAIAHAAAAAAQSNLNRTNNNLNNNSINLFGNNNNNINNNNNNNGNNSSSSNTDTSNQSDVNNFNTGSAQNLFTNTGSNNNLLSNSTKSQSYNNPGFFETTSYPIQNHLESPPPYDAALQQPIKKDSPIQQQRLQQQQQQQQHQQMLNQQQKDYMGSNSRLISGSSTPTQPKHPGATSLSYTAANTPQQTNLSLLNSTPTMSSSLQQLQYQQQQQQLQNQPNLQYTSVHNIENRARSRNPLNGLPNEMDSQQQQMQQQQQQQQTQYSTLAAQLTSNPIDV